LGLVKFLFPNNYNIYFHDTPNRNLFSQSSRSFSHGCIRLGEPKKFAEYMLRFDSSWNSENIEEAMHLAKEKWVTVKKSVPVFLVYFTAWVDKDGLLNFRKDIYGHDEKMSEKLFTN
jgi:murein L,D-transpeptidase YcbB/YkuD